MRPLGIALAVILAFAATAGVAQADRARARQLFVEGERLASEGDAGEALDHFERAIAADPDYLPAYEAATPLWFEAGAFARAARYLERATLRHPTFAHAWYALGYAYRRLARPKLAIIAYESYIDLRPRDAAPRFGLGMAKKQAGDRPGAIAAFRCYLRLEKDPAMTAYVERARQELHELTN